jgi:prevent-host-death family protein
VSPPTPAESRHNQLDRCDHEGAAMEISIRELRDNLSRHLADVRQGRTVTVTDHGRPIARIVPVERLTRLEQLRAEGRVRPASRRKGPAPQPVEGGGTVSDLLPEQRR